MAPPLNTLQHPTVSQITTSQNKVGMVGNEKWSIKWPDLNHLQ